MRANYGLFFVFSHILGTFLAYFSQICNQIIKNIGKYVLSLLVFTSGRGYEIT